MKPSRAVVACRIAAVATVISVLPVVAWAEEPPPPDAPPVYAPGEEVAALRDRFSTTVATATANSYVTTIHSRPVNFRAADGSWQPIDTSFVARADGTLHNAANDVGITVAPTAAQLVHVDIADGVSFGYGLSGALPAIPAVTGSVVTLPSIAPLTNTEVTSRATGLKEEIVLASPLAPTTYVFPLYLHGLTAALDADGNLILSDTTGAERARVPHGWMHDSKVDPHSGDPAESSGVTYALVNSGPTGTALKVTLDPAWLASPLRQYPVRVDPTVTTYTAGSDDTFVEYPYTNDYSTDVLLKSGTWDGGTNKARSFIHFQGADALDDKVINSATVKVWENWSYSCTDSPVNLMRITQSWSGAGLHGYPGFSVSGTIDQTSAHYGYTGCPTQAYVSFDATSAMRNWANDTWQNYGVALVAPDENNSYQWKKWDSAQTTHDPQLVVSWDEPNRAPGQVSGRTITPSTCVGTCTYTTTSDSTPVLTGTATDADADTLRYDFEVYAGILSGVDASGNAAPGSATKVAYGSVSNKASGTQGAWTVSPALADGSYSYRVRAWDGTTYGVWSSGWARFVVDATAPATTVSSSTHPVQTTWYSSNAPTVTWTASTESGVAGYSYVLDQTSSTVADTVSEGTTASKSYTGLADGVWYFHVRTQSKAGVWGTTATFTIRVDVTAPTAPATVTSSPQVPAVPSPNRNVTATWSAGTDATSGVKGYSVVFNNDSATPADTVQDVPATTTSYSSPSLSDGTWWFHVRTIDNAGNASADKTYGPFLIDGTGPDAPVITSPDHSQTAWSTNRTATFAWTTTNGAGGPADATGYSVVFDQAANTDPDTTSETALPAWTQQNIPDGVWYLHVRAVDSANNWGATGSYKVMVDATGPAAPVITSSTHPDEDSAYESNDPSFSWTASDDSGIAGYSVVLDQSQSTVPPATNGGTATTYSANDLDWGQWFLHVRAVNGVGLWGATATFSVSLYPIVDAEARSATTDDPGQTTPLDQVQSLLPAVPHDGPLSGVFPPIDSGLANFYETGPLLGSDSPLGGPFVPNDSPASELGRVVTGMVPPHTALTNIGQTVAEAVGTARSLAQIVPVVVLPAAPTYTLETTPYDANGQPQQTRTDTVPVCTPYVYAPHEQTSYAQAHPTSPIELPALRANLCPDVTSVTSNPRLTYQLDALSANVHARVVVTYQAQGVQIRMVTDAHQNQLPVDSGSGAAINSSYDCQSSTLPVVGPLPLGGTVPQDTQDGFCLELVRLPSDADTQHVQITSDSTGPLDAVEFFQDQPASSSFLPKYHLVVNNLPVSVSHQFDLTARDATAGNRSLYLRLQLADTTVGANETLTLEKYTDSGALNDRLRLSGIPASFDTTFDGVLEDAGDVTTAEVKNATIHGTQTAAPNETLVVEHYSSSTLNDLLTLSSFAADFRFAAEVRKDSAGTLVGGKIDATFQQGVPANGRLQVARYLPDSNGNARLDTYLDMQRFAPATSFETTTRGPASDPTGLVADVSNSTPVTTQVIRALQYPDGGAQRRLVFAGPSATIGQIGDPVLGQNVVWNGAPATYHLDFDVTAQSGSGADPTLPGQVVIQGTASADVATSNLLQVSELRSSGQTVGVNLGSLTQNHYLKINVLGSLSLDGLRSLRIERDSHAANTAQTMQLYVREPSGALSTKVNFTGPQPYTAGLLTQTATTVEGAVSSVPGHFVLAGTFNRDSSNRLNDAHLTGSSPAAAPDMDIVLIEKVRGFSAHLHSLMTTYDYGVHVDYDNNGSPTQAVFTADQSTDNDGAVFDVKYGVNGANLRFVAGGLARTVTDTVKITEGTLSNPLGATITQSQSTDNPNSLLQLVAYPVGSTTARFALTTRNASAGVAPESGSLGDVLWTGVPKNYTLHVSRNLSSSQGAANIDVSLSSARRDADLRMRQVCTGGRTSCTAGSSQQLTIHGLGTSPSFALTYNGSVNSPSALHLRAIDGTRASTDWIELAGYQGTALRDRFVLHGTAASVPSAPAASTIDGDYSGLPGDVSLDYSQVVQSNPARTTVSLTGTTPGHDDPGAVLSVSRTSGSTRQVLTTYGLAPSWSLGGTYDNLHDPNNMLLHLHSSIRHDTDYTSLQNYDSGVYNQKFLFERVEHATVEVLPHKANARFVGYPEDVVLSYVRQQQVVGSRTYDRRFTMTLANSDADGNPVDVGNGYVDASLYDPANVVYDANGYPAANEHIRIDQLPARISNLDYVFPANTITDNTTNCLGDITYNASNSSADLKMTLYSQTDCLAGAVNAKVDDVPKDGFALAALYRDGSGAIVTAADPQFGNQEQTGAVQIDAPLPKGVVDRFNRPVYITSDETATGGDKFICNDAGINAVVKMGCQHIRVTATPHFKDLGLHVSAPSLSYLKIATNVARSTYNAAPHPDRDTDIRDLLWKYVPVFSVDNGGFDDVTVRVTGLDDPSDGKTHRITQHVGCCVRKVQTANFDSTYDITPNSPLNVRFYGWTIKNGDCQNPDPNSTDIKACNANGDELGYGFGSFIHTTNPFGGDADVPFNPRYDTWYNDPGNFANPRNNGFVSHAGTIQYYVPNPYDLFMRQDPGGGAWYARNLARIAQTDWFWASLLHEFPTDPLSMAS